MTFEQDGDSVARLVEFIFALPAEDRLEILRLLTPPILAQLDDDDRGVFIDALNIEIARALIRTHTVARG